MERKLDIAPGVVVWPGRIQPSEQATLIAEVLRLARDAPFYRPQMPVSGKPFSVEETNFGPLGWLSDANGYRYVARHPQTARPWPPMPAMLTGLWASLTAYRAAPECCLVNLYRPGARMGLHQDRDEAALDAPVVSISLGDEAVFRIGGTSRRESTGSFRLRSGDVVVFGGPARLAFHGIDRLIAGSSSRLPGGGRLNLTLRRVTDPDSKKTPDQGLIGRHVRRYALVPEGMTGTLEKHHPACERGGSACRTLVRLSGIKAMHWSHTLQLFFS